MASTLNFEPHRKEQAFKPGPGTYSGDTKLNVIKKEPAWGMGSGKRVDLAFEKKKLFQTAPGQYEDKFNSTKYKAASWGFGSEQRPEVAPKAVIKNPAPSQYSLPSKMVSGPKAAMHARCDNIDMNKKNNYPGAGSYDL